MLPGVPPGKHSADYRPGRVFIRRKIISRRIKFFNFYFFSLYVSISSPKMSEHVGGVQIIALAPAATGSLMLSRVGPPVAIIGIFLLIFLTSDITFGVFEPAATLIIEAPK